MENLDFGTILGIAGVILGVAGIGVSIFFGISQIVKKIRKSKNNINKSFNPKVDRESEVKIEIKDSFNTNHNDKSGD